MCTFITSPVMNLEIGYITNIYKLKMLDMTSSNKIIYMQKNKAENF